MTDQELLNLAAECGFSHVNMLNVPALEFRSEVRDMCSADKCNHYGRCWICPPHCGTLEEVAEKAQKYSRGILVQCTGQMEDDYDVETMLETGAEQKKCFAKLVKAVREAYPSCLPMSAGHCTVCPTCTCPDAPCRFPELAIPSMEAYGLWVSKVCEDSGAKYYYGPQTITYTSCILVD